MAQESEMKLLTEESEFVRCRNILQGYTHTQGDAYVQVNYYFDTPDRSLAASHRMLRVRRKKNALYVQYKTKRTQSPDGIFSCREEEAPLSEFPVLLNPSHYFPAAPCEECLLLGDLVTYRRDFVLPGVVVSLDENTYFGKTDFEIEIEGEISSIRSVAALLSVQGKPDSGNGKFSRFIKAYEQYHLRGEKGDV